MKKYFLTSLILSSSIFSFSQKQNLDSIKTQLENILIENTTIRKDVYSFATKYGFESSEMDSINHLIQQFDSVSLITVKCIIDNYGWLGINQIGKKANQALFVTIQHSTKDVREKYYHLLEKSAKQGESNLSDMATMYDRIQIDNNKLQLYGTQFKMVDGKLVRQPVLNEAELNKRRKVVGLPLSH